MPPAMKAEITSTSVDNLIGSAFGNIQTGVESGNYPLAGEHTLRFLFAWELGRLLDFSDRYRFDFELEVFAKMDTDDRFLDLVMWTDPEYRVAIEFKFPKRGTSGSNTTQTRAKICRDISRLSYLVEQAILSIKVGYFLCATNEGSYLTEGRKERNVQYKTHQGMVYSPGTVLPAGESPNGILRPLRFPDHEVRFEWEGVKDTGLTVRRLAPEGRFAWLEPIKVYR